MMAMASLVVLLTATAGWLFLNWRALQSHGLSFEQKMAMGVAWALIFTGLGFVLTRLGF